MPSRLERYHKTLQYLPGQTEGQESIAVIPQLSSYLNHGVSMGPASANMAESFEQDKTVAINRVEEFLAKLDMPQLKDSFLMTPKRGSFPRAVTSDDVSKAFEERGVRQDIESVTDDSGLFTMEEGVPLLVKPADCPIVLFGTKDRNFAGMFHAGREELNNLGVIESIEFVKRQFNINPEELVLGVTPGIGDRNYYVQKADEHLVDRDRWGEYAYDGDGKVHLMLNKFIFWQLGEAGLTDWRNIYGYHRDVDLYELASQEPRLAFSHRFAVSTNQPEKNGRMLVAVSL